MRRHIMLMVCLLLVGSLAVPDNPWRSEVASGSPGPVAMFRGPSSSARPSSRILPPPAQSLVVSLEWTPASMSLHKDLGSAGCEDDPPFADYLADLEQGLKQMSSYIYHYTHGYVQISAIRINADGSDWDRADIRILANGSYRPTAFIGGQVAWPVLYQRPDGPQVTFTHAPILLSRLWDGQRARCGPWSDPEGWRTLGHEWAHRALGLYDEYIEAGTGEPSHCGNWSAAIGSAPVGPPTGFLTPTTLLRNHYLNNELSGADPLHPETNCAGTPQWLVYGSSAWAALGETLGWSVAGLPLSPPPAPVVTIRRPSVPSTSAPLHLDTQARCPDLFGPAYQLEPAQPGLLDPERIIGQGTLWPDEAERPLIFWGLRPGSGGHALAMLRDSGGGQRYVGFSSGELAPQATNTLALQPSLWHPVITLDPQSDPAPPTPPGEVITLGVDLRDDGATPVLISYCPAGGSCTAPASMQRIGVVGMETTWHYSFPFSQSRLAEYGYIYARQDVRDGEEAVIWYQQAGGVGPAHSGGLAPTAEGLLNVELLQNSPSTLAGDHRVIYSTALLSTSNLLADAERILDVPLRFSIYPSFPPDTVVRVRLNYTQDMLEHWGLGPADESHLVVVQYLNGVWQTVAPVEKTYDPDLNWVSTSLTLDTRTSVVVALALEGTPAHTSPCDLSVAAYTDHDTDGNRHAEQHAHADAHAGT